MANEKMKNKINKSKTKIILNEDGNKIKVKDFLNLYSDESGGSDGVLKNKKQKVVRKSSEPDISATTDSSLSLVTSTPIVKSIMKIKPEVVVDESGTLDFSAFKNKKRAKSVSFNLDDDKSENKKMKSDQPEENAVNHKKLLKKDEQNVADAIKLAKLNKKKMKAEKNAVNESSFSNKQKRKVLPHDPEVDKENESYKQVSEDGIGNLNKKSKRRNEQDEEIPDKPDIITENLESLNIGENPHSITSLLDEMTVTNKKKDKIKSSKNKIKKGKNKEKNAPETVISGEGEEKENTKWNKRKWNKDRKGEVGSETNHAVVVSNLPINMLLTFKKILGDLFSSVGTVKKIGVAEFYLANSPTPVFTTTVHFSNEDVIQKALSVDCSRVCGNKLRVSQLLPAKETTAVLRTFGALTHTAICSALSHFGPIRNIRLLTKGKNSIGTAFIEFDGPESVERVIAEANNTKIGGKKVHIAKYEPRKSNTPTPSVNSSTTDIAKGAKHNANKATTNSKSAKNDDCDLSTDDD